MHKRRHGRVRADSVAGQVQSEGGALEPTRVENLSLGGALLRTAQPIAVGAPVALQLHRPGMAKALLVTGRVVSMLALKPDGPRRNAIGLGIAFDPLDEDSERRLKDLLQRLAPGPAVLEGDSAPPAPPARPSAPPVSPSDRLHRAASEVARERASRPVSPPSGRPAAGRPPASIAVGHGPPVLQPLPPVSRVTAPHEGVKVPESAKLMVQVRGLLLELSEANERAARLEKENERLRKQLADLAAQVHLLRRQR